MRKPGGINAGWETPGGWSGSDEVVVPAPAKASRPKNDRLLFWLKNDSSLLLNDCLGIDKTTIDRSRTPPSRGAEIQR